MRIILFVASLINPTPSADIFENEIFSSPDISPALVEALENVDTSNTRSTNTVGIGPLHTQRPN